MSLSPLLKGKQVYLTAIRKSDAGIITGWFQDTDFLRQLDAAIAAPKSHEDIEKWIEEGQTQDDGYLFAICLNSDDSLAGYLELDGILWNHQTGWLSLGVGPAHQNRGIGYEAIQLALQFAFNELNLRRVQLSVFSYNRRAIALYEKLGFQHEGTARQAIHRDGQISDMHWYGLLRSEWKGKSNA